MPELRPAKPEDARSLAALAESTFRETFSKDNSAEDMDLFVANTYGEEKQLAEILDPNLRTVIATEAGEFVGFYQLKANKAHEAVPAEKAIEVSRIYVDARWHGKKVAHALMTHALINSLAEGFRTIWLGVWEENFRAQAFYKKWGFREVGSHIFTLGNDKQRDLIFSKSLTETPACERKSPPL